MVLNFSFGNSPKPSPKYLVHRTIEVTNSSDVDAARKASNRLVVSFGSWTLNRQLIAASRRSRSAAPTTMAPVEARLAVAEVRTKALVTAEVKSLEIVSVMSTAPTVFIAHGFIHSFSRICSDFWPLSMRESRPGGGGGCCGIKTVSLQSKLAAPSRGLLR